MSERPAGLRAVLYEFLRLPTAPPRLPEDGHAHIDVFRASPRALNYLYFLAALGLLPTVPLYVVISGALVASGERWALIILGVLWAFVALKVAFVLALVRFEWELRYYVVTDRSLRVREGAWITREVTLTYANVQNVTVEQGPVERMLGIANVIVDTAGGSRPLKSQSNVISGHRAILKGIENAEQVRDLIRRYLQITARHSGLGDPDDDHEGAHSAMPDSGLLLEILQELQQTTRAARDKRVREPQGPEKAGPSQL